MAAKTFNQVARVGVDYPIKHLSIATVAFDDAMGGHVVEVLTHRRGWQLDHRGQLTDRHLLVHENLDHAQTVGMGKHSQHPGCSVKHLRVKRFGSLRSGHESKHSRLLSSIIGHDMMRYQFCRVWF